MKTVLLSTATLLALANAPVQARTVPVYYLPAGAAAVALSMNTAIAPFEAGLRFGAAPHQDITGRAWDADAASAGHARQGGAKPSKVPEMSTPALLAAAGGMLLLARRRRVDNSVR